MPVKIVEWELPYTAWPWIDIDANKVISLLLREENNLIYINDNDEAYVDLQFASWLTPNSDFPVWVTVGKVLQADWWTKSWLVLNRKTTSGDYARWIYAADWTLYLDPGTWTWKQVYYSSDIDAMLAAINARIDNIEVAWVVWIEITAIANGVATGTITDWELVRWCVFDMYLGDGVTPARITSFRIDGEEYNVRPELAARQYMTWIYNIYEDDTGCFFMFDWDAAAQVNADWNAVSWPAQILNKPTIPSVIDNLSSTSTTSALSANMWKTLNDKILDLSWLGKFLSLWNASTGQPISFPLDTPYAYTTWDYFLVEVVSSATPPVNYKPTGSSYTGTVSSTTESDELEVWDVYIYDWTTWLLQSNHGKTVAFANIAGQPSDNTALDNALDAKQDVLTAWTGIAITSNTVSTLNNFGTSSTAAATVQKEVSIPWIKTLNVGQVVHILPSTTSTVASSTLKVNNFTAYPMRYNGADITTSTDSVVRPANIVTSFVFDWTYWQFLWHGLDSNTTYSNMSASEANTGTATSARTISASVLKWAVQTHAPVKSVNWQTWVVNLTIPTYNAWPWIAIWNYSAVQWPAPDGFHIPSKDERAAVVSAWTTLWGWGTAGTNFSTYLKLPRAGYRLYNSASVSDGGSWGHYWSYTSYGSTNARSLYNGSSIIDASWSEYRASWLSIRCFKNVSVTPTSSWTKLYWTSIEAWWIFWSSTDWLISISWNWASWITMADKNLWATQVWNSWDTLSEANCGYFFQRWNNYGFAYSGSVTTSSTKVDASTYWPWNYYSSSTFITWSNDWSSVRNDNLWWWVTWPTLYWENAITNTGVLSVNWNTWAVTVTPFSPSNSGSTWNVLTKTSSGYNWAAPTGWDFTISTQANNILTSWVPVRAGTQANYDNLGTYDNNWIYLII